MDAMEIAVAVLVVLLLIVEQFAYAQLIQVLPKNKAMERRGVFLSACTSSRLLLALGAPYIPDSVRPVFLLIAGGFFFNFAKDAVRGEDGAPRVGFFGGPVWWQYLRPVHALLYSLAYFYPDHARTLLLVDLGVGLAG